MASRSPRSGISVSRASTRSPFVREPRIGGEVRPVDGVAESLPLALAADGDGDRAVRGVERLVRDDVRVGVAPSDGSPGP